MEELSATQIAARIGRSERTAQRYIASGKLKATLLANNRYAVETADLEALLLPTHTAIADSEVMLARLTAMEHEVTTLKQRMTLLESREGAKREQIDTLPISHKPPVSRPPQRQTRASHTKAYLPEGLVPWRGFAEQHGISSSTIQKAIATGRLPVVRGEWILLREAGGNTVKGALDARGRARFYELYHMSSHFKSCERCPH